MTNHGQRHGRKDSTAISVWPKGSRAWGEAQGGPILKITHFHFHLLTKKQDKLLTTLTDIIFSQNSTINKELTTSGHFIFR